MFFTVVGVGATKKSLGAHFPLANKSPSSAKVFFTRTLTFGIEIEFFPVQTHSAHSLKISLTQRTKKSQPRLMSAKSDYNGVCSRVAGIICSTGPWSSRTFCRKTPKTTTRCSRPRRKVSVAFYLFSRAAGRMYAECVTHSRCFRGKLFAMHTYTYVTRAQRRPRLDSVHEKLTWDLQFMRRIKKFTVH
jgi:hypothetical protein